jgi:hypothetical protein
VDCTRSEDASSTFARAEVPLIRFESERAMNTRLITVGVAAALSVAVFVPRVAAAPAAPPPTHPRRVDPPPGFLDGIQSRSSRVSAAHHAANGIQTWKGAFRSAGTRYGYTMVGTDPAAGSRTTNVPVRILPLRFTFDGGITLDGTDVVKDIEHSPIFKQATYRSGRTQYGDAMQRASFWNDVSTRSPRYHVLLSHPRVLSTLSLQVPKGSGSAITTNAGPAGIVSTGYLVSLLPRLADFYDPSSLLIIVTKDVEGDTFLGFHFSFTPAGEAVPMTLIFTGYFTPGGLVGPALSDAYVLSHEVAEWINDPFVTNFVPPWRDPASGACFNDLLEVADPVEFLPNPSFTVRTDGRTYHVTDTAGISWFAHDVPSRELGGAYSYDGNLQSFSSLC